MRTNPANVNDTVHRNTKFLLYAGGIFVSYFYYALLQEKITKGKYPEEQVDEDGKVTTVYEKYTYMLSLVFIQCLVSYIAAKLVVTYKNEQESPAGKGVNMNLLYCGTAITYLTAMVCSNMALQWVPYPTQVLKIKI